MILFFTFPLVVDSFGSRFFGPWRGCLQTICSFKRPSFQVSVWIVNQQQISQNFYSLLRLWQVHQRHLYFHSYIFTASFKKLERASLVVYFQFLAFENANPFANILQKNQIVFIYILQLASILSWKFLGTWLIFYSLFATEMGSDVNQAQFDFYLSCLQEFAQKFKPPLTLLHHEKPNN